MLHRVFSVMSISTARFSFFVFAASFLSLLFLLLPLPVKAQFQENSEAPVHLKSNQLHYFKDKSIYIAEGETVITQGTTELQADSVKLNERTGRLDAIGHIRYFDGENNLEAERIQLNMNSELGRLYQGRVFLKKESYFLTGKTIIRHSKDHYEVLSGEFTTCACKDDPAWKIKAAVLDLQTGDYLVTKHLRFYAGDVPIFYMPIFWTPATKDRKTGLLIPRIGYSTQYGFRIEQDLYWAISKSQDATLTLNHRGNKGDGLGLEYRYVRSKKAKGELKVDYFSDKEKQVDRWNLRFVHEQQFTNRIQGKLDVKYASENNNLSELSQNTTARAQQNIESNLTLSYRGNNSFAYLLGRYTQDLTQDSNSGTPQRLPEIGYEYFESQLGESPLYFNFESSAVNFWSEKGLDLQRVDLYPRLSLPRSLGKGVTLTPWAGFRETWYSQGVIKENGDKKSAINRTILPAGLRFRATAARQGKGLIHQIQTELSYETISVQDGEGLIEIDGLDTLHDRENITASILQRWLIRDPDGFPLEKASIRLSETLHLGDLPKEALSKRYSDIRAELALKPGPHFSLNTDVFYDADDASFPSIQADLKLQATSFLGFTVGHRYARAGSLPEKGDLFNPYYLGDRESVSKTINFQTIETKIKTPWGLNFSNKIYTDSESGQNVELDYRLEFHAECWSIGLTYIEFNDRNSFSFLISLKGLGSFSPDK